MAEFKRFDPDRWEPEAGDVDAAKVAKAAKASEGSASSLATFATLASNGDALPGVITAGLALLDAAKPPKGVVASSWRVAVTDAQRLASDGWAAKALCLGWSALDLFGAVADKLGDPAADGLAVKLSGRPVLALCGSFATVRDGPSSRSNLYRGNNAGARMLWDFGPCGR